MTRLRSRVRCGIFAAAVLLAGHPLAAQSTAAGGPPAGEILIERTVAVVGGAVLTQSDVEMALNFGLIPPAPGNRPSGGVTTSTSGAADTAIAALIDRWLMLHEVARFAPAEPAAAAVQARLEMVRVRAGGEAALLAALSRGGLTMARLAGWVRDDLRITAYLDQRFASAGLPPDTEVASYVEAHRAEFAATGASAEDIARLARERLVAERRRDLISDWLADLRRRTEVVEFARPPA